MLVPNRFSNLKVSLTNISALVIEFLLEKDGHISSIKEVENHLKKTSKELDRKDIVQVVTFLFAIGKINYLMINDTIELTI